MEYFEVTGETLQFLSSTLMEPFRLFQLIVLVFSATSFTVLDSLSYQMTLSHQCFYIHQQAAIFRVTYMINQLDYLPLLNTVEHLAAKEPNI